MLVFVFFFIHTIIVRTLIKSKIEHISYNVSCKIGVTTGPEKNEHTFTVQYVKGQVFFLQTFYLYLEREREREITPHIYRTYFVSCLPRIAQKISHTFIDIYMHAPIYEYTMGTRDRVQG